MRSRINNAMIFTQKFFLPITRNFAEFIIDVDYGSSGIGLCYNSGLIQSKFLLFKSS